MEITELKCRHEELVLSWEIRGVRNGELSRRVEELERGMERVQSQEAMEQSQG